MGTWPAIAEAPGNKTLVHFPAILRVCTVPIERPLMPVVSMGQRNTSLIGGGCDGAWLSVAVCRGWGGDLGAVAGRSCGEADGSGAGALDRDGPGGSSALRWDPAASSTSVGLSVELDRAGGDLPRSGGRHIIACDRGRAGS